MYYIEGSPTKRANKRQRRIKRKARESTARIVRNQTPVTNLKTALSQIKSFDINGKKKQARSSFYIRNLTRNQAKAKRRSPVVTP